MAAAAMVMARVVVVARVAAVWDMEMEAESQAAETAVRVVAGGTRVSHLHTRSDMSAPNVRSAHLSSPSTPHDSCARSTSCMCTAPVDSSDHRGSA